MRKGLIFVAIASLGVVGTAFAGLPCAAYSVGVLDLAVPNCNQTDVIWCPAGDPDGGITIRVTVRDCLENPVVGCDVRLDISGGYDPNPDVLGGAKPILGHLCGTGTQVLTTGANGDVAFPIHGGGAVMAVLDWTATALCADPDVELMTVSDTVCCKSWDITGDGTTTFWDTFAYLPLLQATVGYSGDWDRCDGTNTVTFWDTFSYLPHLQGAHSCAGYTLTVLTGLVGQCDPLFN